jgi:Family of unknown function (DUF6365)
MSKVLFVAPHEVSTGEAMTALHMARELRTGGIDSEFLVSPLCARLIESYFPQQVSKFTRSRCGNQSLWRSILDRFRPDAVIFADYPLLFFASGSVPLVDEAWVMALDQTDVSSFTLDHLGYARSTLPVFFGPSHIPIGAVLPVALPSRMQILLPCPTHEPDAAGSGKPFRYLPLPGHLSDPQRDAIRSRYTDGSGDLLVLHSTPNWAHRLADEMGLPHYRYLSRFLEYYFSGLGRRVTVVSVNDADLLAPSRVADIRFVNSPMMPPVEYEMLIQASDLMLTNNAVSASLAKAVCSLTPCASFCNSYSLLELLAQEDWPGRQSILEMENERLGSIFPFEVYPIWNRQDLDDRQCCDADGYGRTFARIEWFGGRPARDAVKDLLLDPATRAALKGRQVAYLRRLEELPTPSELLRSRWQQ